MKPPSVAGKDDLKWYASGLLAAGDYSVACRADLEDFVNGSLSADDRDTIAARLRTRIEKASALAPVIHPPFQRGHHDG